MITSNDNTSLYPDFITDEKGYRHQLGEKIGEGGQGAVFRTSDPNIVIKTLVDPVTGRIVQNEARYDKFMADINEIRILNIPEGIHIAKPIHLLKRPYCGYIMRLLSDMIPIKKLIAAPSLDLAEFYLETGGLRRRLQLLSGAAKILARIHSMPVVYADISPDNLFVSENLQAGEVWFIDPDNMRHTVDVSKTIFTPGYGAPEIVKAAGSNNTLSDIYSFALLAFEVLAQNAPFEGDLLTEGGGWDEEETDNYAKAERGEIPWIEDVEDGSNRTGKGIPRVIVLSQLMKGMFQQTFGYQGRQDPAARPSMRQWHEVLRQAADATLACGKCGGTFYMGNNVCPFCNAARETVCLVRITDKLLLEEEDGSEIEHYVKGPLKIFDRSGGGQFLYSFHTDDTLLTDDLEETVELQLGGKVESIRNLTGKEMVIHHQGKPPRILEAYGIYQSVDFHQAVLLISVHEKKTRQISFTMM